MKKLLTAIAVAPLLIASGPFSKFDERQPVADYVTKAGLDDVERCLMDMDGWLAPAIYQQADRPDRVTMLWFKGGSAAGIAQFRVDLFRVPAGAHIKSWMPAKQAGGCAPAL